MLAKQRRAPRLIAIMSLLLTAMIAWAGPPDRSCQCDHDLYEPARSKVLVINRHLSLSTERIQSDPVVGYAIRHALAMIYDAIPISQEQAVMRTFRFKRSWPAYQPVRRGQESVRQESVVNTVYGYIRNNVVIRNGTIELDVPDETLMQLVTPRSSQK